MAAPREAPKYLVEVRLCSSGLRVLPVEPIHDQHVHPRGFVHHG